MIVTEGVIDTFRARSLVNSTIRRFLEDREFSEVRVASRTPTDRSTTDLIRNHAVNCMCVPLLLSTTEPLTAAFSGRFSRFWRFRHLCTLGSAKIPGDCLPQGHHLLGAAALLPTMHHRTHVAVSTSTGRHFSNTKGWDIPSSEFRSGNSSRNRNGGASICRSDL